MPGELRERFPGATSRSPVIHNFTAAAHSRENHNSSQARARGSGIQGEGPLARRPVACQNGQPVRLPQLSGIRFCCARGIGGMRPGGQTGCDLAVRPSVQSAWGFHQAPGSLLSWCCESNEIEASLLPTGTPHNSAARRGITRYVSRGD